MIGSEGQPIPIDWILDIQIYRMHIRYNTPAEGSISWVGETVLFQQMQLSIEQVQGIVYRLAVEAKRLLVRELLILEVDGEGEATGGLPGIV